MEPRRLHELLLDRAGSDPDRVAIVDGGRNVRYGELAARALRAADAFRRAGVGPGDRVAVWLDKGIEAITALQAASCAGALAVPLDPAGPATRTAKVLRACEPALLLVGPRSRPKLEPALAGMERPRVGWFDAAEPPEGADFDLTPADVERADEARPAGGPAESPAHILFTSGSTGEPKGVVVRHSGVLAFVAWANRYFDVRPGDRNSGHSPLFFDLSTYDIYGSFAAGAELHLVPQQLNLLPAQLARFIRERRLTQWFSVPSVLNFMAKFDVVAGGDFPDLRRLLWCGEVFPTPAVRYFMERLPHVRFTNLYGPTEATIASSYYTLPGCPADDRAEIPIGRACEGEELFVIDERGRRRAAGEVGELCIAGVGLAEGYWRDAAATARAFIEHPDAPGRRAYRTGDLARQGEDGLFYFLGRADSQIKSRGYRIDLGEIETALAALPWLREAAVVAVPTGGFEGWAICCAFVPQPGDEPEPRRIKRALARDLPGYMVPHRFRAWPALPRTPNGKIDRKALRAAFEAETDACPGDGRP